MGYLVESMRKKTEKKVVWVISGMLFVLLFGMFVYLDDPQSQEERAWEEYTLSRGNHKSYERAMAQKLCAPAYQLARAIVPEIKPESEWCEISVRYNVEKAMAEWDAEHPAPPNPRAK